MRREASERMRMRQLLSYFLSSKMEFLNLKSAFSIVFLVVYKSIEFTTVFSEWIALPWFEFGFCFGCQNLL